MRFPVLLILPCILLASPVRAAGCQVTPFRMMYGLDTQSQMVVRSGQPCGISMGAGPGRTYSAGGGNGLSVAEAPEHGSVAVVGGNGIAYRPAPGYTGPDRFTFQSTGEVLPVRGPPLRGTARVMMDVNVVP